MKIRHKFRRKLSVGEIIENHFSNLDAIDDKLILLVDLVHVFRPKNPDEIETVSIAELLVFLEENPHYKIILKQYLRSIIKRNKFSRLLTDAAILNDNHFFSEVRNRIFDKILPFQPEKDTLQFVLNQVFYLSTDPIWINKIPFEELQKLVKLLEVEDIYSQIKKETALSEIVIAMQLLSQRMSGRALENEVIKMVPEYASLETPFLTLEKKINKLYIALRNNPNHFVGSNDVIIKRVLKQHAACHEFINKAFFNSSKYGISLSVNQSLLRIRQQLVRLKEILQLVIVDREEDREKNSILILLKLIKYNCIKYNVRQLLLESTQIVSYEITQHTAKTGQKYATDGYKEYFKMLYAAMGGGIIVGFLCFFKLIFLKMQVSDFMHAFLYSLNYASGFIIIFLLGYTLATKQPAMTAATIAQTLDEGIKSKSEETNKHNSFAKLFARIFRTQFIAFVGNVVFVFPVALCIIWFFHFLTGHNLASTKAAKLINDLSPITSLALLHAAIAGVFLFLSGIISGSISNRNKHFQVPYRIQENPLLKLTFGIQRTKKMANWVDRNWAGIISNMWFGIFLGSTGSIGVFLGLNLDIRHITFASGNFALGLYGSNFAISLKTFIWSILGIISIGFVNFIVSFSLSMLLAFRSRNIPFSEFRLLNKSIWNYFKKAPLHFFFPLKEKVF
ncbi:Recombinase [Flavobacterium sp. 9AF]|uniref:recombinase n=1 Tax=Flavobacterium sp. 9AF TaxID=2653142 RepID=UPI0012F16B04|nr:recombinase [Flavobacterium sp. 9AF]VXB28315.1 Recombinase [Flavobacterium sp. 9AF]